MPLPESQQAVRQIQLAIVLLVAMLLIGAAGFWLTDENPDYIRSLWMTINILTTVGDSGEELNDIQRFWAAVVMLAGVMTVFTVGVNLVGSIVEGDVRRLLGKRHLKKQISQLEDHYIVCGFGLMGRALCDLLHKKRVPFVVIERDASRTAIADESNYLYLLGDAMSEADLLEAHLESAQGLAACLRNDADNVFATLSAKEVNPDLTIIARAENIESVSKLKRAGADRVICPPLLGADKIMRMLIHPAVDELMELAVSGPDLEVTKVDLRPLKRAHHKTLRELALPSQTGMMVVAAVKKSGERTFNPPPEWKLEPTDELIVIGAQGGVDKLTDMLT